MSNTSVTRRDLLRMLIGLDNFRNFIFCTDEMAVNRDRTSVYDLIKSSRKFLSH